MLIVAGFFALLQQSAALPPTNWGSPTPTQVAERVAQGGSAIPSVVSVGSVLDTTGVALTFNVPPGLSVPFAILRGTTPADTFRSARVRVSGEIRSADVTEGVALWLRIDDARGRSLKLDNGEQRKIPKGTEWIPFETTVEVPPDAQTVVFGVILWGAGEANVRRLRLVKVGGN